MENLCHRDTEVKAIINKFNQLTYHPYLKDYIPEVGMDEGKCQLFYQALSKKVAAEEASVVTLCVMLVQAALDVHEEVSLHPVQSDLARKHRQLRVLIGDFYSSLYYYLLAEADRVPLTRIFSYTLQEINELKMDVYSTPENTYELVAEKLTYIDSVLYEKMLEEYDLQSLSNRFQTIFYYHRFVEEWNLWADGKKSILMNTLTSTSTDASWKEIYQRYELLKERVDQVLLTTEDFTVEMKQYLQDHVPPIPTSYIEGKAR